ncbi:hypothetical protein [Paenibacillus polymyxa]|uniref:hypothetical protein n=1 Tax=Paenibacillus polymyxa TaxID=1406 RepID=UPI001FD0991D|nr:hypothetical protein [Paenibacillus polymyxa]
MQYGVSGFLAPDGNFYECKYGEHRVLAVELVEKFNINTFDGDSNKVPDFIKFGFVPGVGKEGDPGSCHAFIWQEPTPQQLIWLHANLEHMTGVQQRSVLSWLDAYGIDV